MKFKLDENFGARTQSLFQSSGHDVSTVLEEKLGGTTDAHLFEACKTEQRCLLTLDLDFSDPVRFPPTDTSGIVVIRVPRNPSLVLLETLVKQFLQLVEQLPVQNKLWIVEVGRIRVHQSESETPDADL